MTGTSRMIDKEAANWSIMACEVLSVMVKKFMAWAPTGASISSQNTSARRNTRVRGNGASPDLIVSPTRALPGLRSKRVSHATMLPTSIHNPMDMPS